MYRQLIRGIAPDPAYHALLGTAGDHLADLIGQADGPHPPPYLALPVRHDDLEQFKALADQLKRDFSDIVVLGTGGSSLGARAVLALQGRLLDRDPETVRVHCPDNLHPYDTGRILSDLPLARTHFIAVSKSGGTAETVAQMLAAFDAVRAAGLAPAPHFTLVSEPKDSVFTRFAAAHGLALLDHDPALGGRYSVMSVTGLLPGYIAGIDGAAIRQGAAAMLDHARGAGSAALPVAGATAAVYLFTTAGVNIDVLMPYDDRLERFGAWYQQLWAESIGKAGTGTTPVAAQGPVDQHSQVQLYMDGPADKFFTVISERIAGSGPAIAADLTGDPALDYLGGNKTIGDLVEAEAEATVAALLKRGRPVRHIVLDRLDARTLGALMMQFMLETVIACRLLGVDPFDQPAVEDSKIITRDLLRGDADATRVTAALTSDQML